MTSKTLELIKCAAIRLTDGAVYTGRFHGDALQKADKDHARISASRYRRLFEDSEDGFMTNKGRFVSREEAYEIAVRSRQMTPDSYADAVQDLWGEKPQGVGELGAVAFGNARIERR